MSTGERRTKRPGWKWQEGVVDPDHEHIELRYGDAHKARWEEWIPVALVGKPRRRIFPVRWLTEPPAVDPAVMAEVRRELDFYLVEKREPHPWAYALYHCGTAANMYSRVHWSYFPSGREGERHSSMVVHLSAREARRMFGEGTEPDESGGK